jgi:glycosyltransferase involved in cell wall biosynthesis
MKVSVIIPCLNEEANINACVNTLINQTYPLDKYEIIVVDGGSIDRTLELVKEIEKSYPNVRLIVELKKGTAAGRNAGVVASQFDHVAFIDADCESPSNWLAILVKNYQEAKKHDKMIIAVGGTNIPPKKTTNFVHAVGIALDSFPGSFSSVQGRRFKKSVYIQSLSTLNVLYDKQKIIEIGYFDETLGSEAEDADINFRLTTSGYRLYFIPDSFVWHKMRPTPESWLKNMLRYGKGRARLLKRYPVMWAVSYVLPLLFIMTMFSIFLIPFSKIFILSLLYFPAIFFYSLLQCIKKRSAVLVFHVLLVYLIQHFGYAGGEIYGLLNPKVK